MVTASRPITVDEVTNENEVTTRRMTAVQEAARSGHAWFVKLPAELQDSILQGKIPILLVIGATGTGKSTFINRITTDIKAERSKVVPEGHGAAAGTAAPQARLLSWGGDDRAPVLFIDMPGLNDPEGKDLSIIRDLCSFLTTLSCLVVHQIVLVVDGQNPRLSQPLKESIRLLRDVFDEGGRNGFFVDYLSVMFTKIPYGDWVFEEPEKFEALVDSTKRALADSWASRDTGLGHKNVLDLSDEACQLLKMRFHFVNNALPPNLLRKLGDLGLPEDLGLSDIYAHALRFVREENPFRLNALNADVKTPSQRRLDDVAAWMSDLHRQASEVHAGGPYDEDALESRLKPIFERKLAELEAMGLEHALADLVARVKACYKDQERINEMAAKRFNSNVADRIIAACRTDVQHCRQEINFSGPDTAHDAYFRFFNAADYVERYIGEKRGSVESTIEGWTKVNTETKQLILELRNLIFGADYVERQTRQAMLHATNRRCPRCKIAWWRESGCDNVRCGHSTWKEGGNVIPPPASGCYGLVHGCGFKFDWHVAPQVSEADERRFWELHERTIEAQQRQEQAKAEALERKFRQPTISSVSAATFRRVRHVVQSARSRANDTWTWLENCMRGTASSQTAQTGQVR